MGSFITMTMSDGADVAVYRAGPVGERRGGLVLVQEIFGVNAHIRAVADDYAAEGYEVLAPALFDREHPGFEVGYDADGMAAGLALSRERHPLESSIADVGACIDALKHQGPVFIAGYCYGGSVVWYAAARFDALAAASAYYGRLIPEAADLRPKCPTIAHFGRNDAGIPLEGVEMVIAAGHRNVEVFLYDAGHGFNCDARADYDPASAALAKARTLVLFRANGG